MSNLNVVKQVPLSKQMANVVEERIQELGIKFPEYVRHLILRDTDGIETLSQSEEKSLERGVKDYREGNVTTIHNSQELRDYMKKLSSVEND